MRTDTAAIIPKPYEPGKGSCQAGKEVERWRIKQAFRNIPPGAALTCRIPCRSSPTCWMPPQLFLAGGSNSSHSKKKKSSAMCGGMKRHNPQQGSQRVLCALSTVAIPALEQLQLVLLIPQCVQGNWNWGWRYQWPWPLLQCFLELLGMERKQSNWFWAPTLGQMSFLSYGDSFSF